MPALTTKKLLLSAVGLVAASALAVGGWSFYVTEQMDGDFCAQVLTDARDPATGEVKTFLTPCDVPAGWDRLETDHEFFSKGAETWTRYRNDDLGIRFEYRVLPDGYLLVKESTSTVPQKDLVEFISLFNKKDYEEAVSSTVSRELPPAITAMIYNNPQNLTPEQWVRAERAVSGIGLVRSPLASLQFSGNPAVRYATDGLYMNDVVVASNNKRIYYISGSYINEDSLIRKDFLAMLPTFALY